MTKKGGSFSFYGRSSGFSLGGCGDGKLRTVFAGSLAKQFVNFFCGVEQPG